jgi:hypothetical protein
MPTLPDEGSRFTDGGTIYAHTAKLAALRPNVLLPATAAVSRSHGSWTI